MDSNYGANLFIFQALFSNRVYWILSCKRLTLPCQNSILWGITKKPPQLSGNGTSTLIYFSSNSLYLLSKIARLSNTWLCGEAIAPIWLSLGLEWKYCSAIFLSIFCTIPSMRICRSAHQNNKATFEFSCICFPLWLS